MEKKLARYYRDFLTLESSYSGRELASHLNNFLENWAYSLPVEVGLTLAKYIQLLYASVTNPYKTESEEFNILRREIAEALREIDENSGSDLVHDTD